MNGGDSRNKGGLLVMIVIEIENDGEGGEQYWWYVII